MIDVNGNLIDLALIDAIGQLPDGRFDVWMDDGTRVLTEEHGADDVWRSYLRAKFRINATVTVPPSIARPEFSWRNGMNRVFTRETKKIALNILDQLLSQDSDSTSYLVTNDREEYDFLLDAAFKGVLGNLINLSRSGIWLNKKRIVPPESYFVQMDVRNAASGRMRLF